MEKWNLRAKPNKYVQSVGEKVFSKYTKSEWAAVAISLMVNDRSVEFENVDDAVRCELVALMVNGLLGRED